MTCASFLETPNAIRRRKVLMHLLVPVIGSRASLDAVVLWEKHFGSNETLLASVVEYSKLLGSTVDIKTQPLLFSNTFIQTLLKPPASLAEMHDPIGMGRILLSREQDAGHTNTADNSSVF